MDFVDNPEYPEETFEAFVGKLIAFKKDRIAEMVTKRLCQALVCFKLHYSLFWL